MKIRTGNLLAALCSLHLGAAPAQEESSAATPEAEAQAPIEQSIAVQPLRPAQDPAAQLEDSGAQLDDIVVTAQRKVESLQETPISIAAFNSEQIELRRVDGLADLSNQVPSLSIEPFPTSNATLRFYIRGLGLIDAQVTQDPAVGVYIDGVYIARSSGNTLDIADLERIEVLRGPQGTLYGRNTTGGAINLVTRRPALGVYEFLQKFSMGNRGILQSKTAVNVPLGRDVAVKIALLGSVREGFTENSGPGAEFGDRKALAGRFDLRWQATDTLIADYTYELSDTDYVNPLYQAQLTPERNKGTAELIKRYGQENTVYADHRLDTMATGAPMETSNTRIEGHALTLTQPVGDYELKYIGAWRKLSDAAYADLGGGAGSTKYRLDSHAYDGPAADLANGGPTPLAIPETTQTQWSHEVQISGGLFDQSVEFVAGAFYFTETAREDRRTLQHQLSSAISPAQTFGVLGPLQASGLVPVDAVLPRLVNLLSLDNRVDNDAIAAFSQATWTPQLLDQRLHLTLGYRFSRDQREAVKYRTSDNYLEYQVGGEGFAAPLSSAEPFNDERGEVSYTDHAASVVLAFDATRKVNTYAKYVQAYKSGGFNTRDPQVSGDSGPASDGVDYGYGFAEGFAPEYVDSYELGVKTELFGRTLRLNADVFLSEYTDMQINFLIGGTITDTKTANAGRAQLTGAEFDATWRAGEDLLLQASYAYLDAEITEVIDRNGENVAEQYQFSSAPPHSYTVAADWSAWRSESGATLGLHVGYNYVGEQLGGAVSGRSVHLPARGLVDVRLGYDGIRMGGGDVSVALWARNLLDEEYPINAIDNLPQADRAVIWGEARTMGVDAIYRFGR